MSLAGRRAAALTAAAALGAACLLALAPGARAGGLTLGFMSDPLLVSGQPATMSQWAGRAVRAGAGAVRLNVAWARIAPVTPPAGFDPTDPASPGYDWSVTDEAVRVLARQHLNIVATLYSAPRWAEGADMPAGAAAGSWKPDPAAFAAFATAAARRYSGHFRDPLNPRVHLPRITFWQGWNEPNLEGYLAPSWDSHGHLVSPDAYRLLLNAFYGAIKRVSSRNVVVMAGTAPYGDRFNCGCQAPFRDRVRPVLFYRSLFCITSRLHATRCPSPTYLDGIDHHPYQLLPPQYRAYWGDDVAVPDIWKITRLLKAAVRLHHVLPGGRKRVWTTEITWDSNPPSTAPGAAPLAQQACYYELAMYLLWRQGVDTVMLLQLRDQPSMPGFTASFEWGGIFFNTSAPKPSYTAYSFPLVARRAGHGHIVVWGRAPRSGKLTLARRAGRRWRALATLHVRAHQVFQVTLPWRGALNVRGQVGRATSLPWTWGSASCPRHGAV